MGSHLMRPPSGFRGVFRTDEDARAVYSEAAGIGRAHPAAVAVPVDAEDVVTLVRWAAETTTPLVPRGSGSSMGGGAIGTGVIVDLGRLDVIGEVDRAGRGVLVGPGAIRESVNAAAARAGLRFPVDPSSGRFCTIGGMVATNAAGPRTLRYGATRRWVTALDCVFDDGSRALIRRGEAPPSGIAAIDRFLQGPASEILAEESVSSIAHAVRKESSGYAVAEYARGRDLVDLLVGSEGTLALFVGVELALAPAAAATSSILAAFPSLEAAAEAAGAARAVGASACELLDRTFLEIARRTDLPPDTEAVLLAEIEGEDATDARASAHALERAFERAGATTVRVALEPEDETGLWELRHAASPTLSRMDPALKSMQFVEDAAVPVDRLPDYVRGVRAALEGAGVRGVIFGHAGDAHVHVNPLIDVSDPRWRHRVEQVLDEVTSLVASLGGTLSGEHGDGRLRAPLLSQVWRWPAPNHFLHVKRAFDPRGILNPGVKVPLPNQSAIEAVKYDPALPPLPDRARAALDRVEQDRAYARPRLELLSES